MHVARTLLAVVIIASVASSAALAGPIGFVAYDPLSQAFFDVSVNLAPTPPADRSPEPHL